jgi:hypothetical protein
MSIALLAPVPEEHLLSALDTVEREGQVAFGSKSWELFDKLDSFLAGQDCDVLIYASDPSRPINPPTVTWVARYLSTSLAVNGAWPQPTHARKLYSNLNHIRVRSFVLSGAPFHAHAAETSQLQFPRNRATSPL